MKTKRIIISFILALVCLLFTGCSSYVSVYTTKVMDGYYNCGIELFVASSDIEMLETNSEGTVKNYLSSLASTCGVSNSTTIQTDDKGNIYLSLNATAESVRREEYSTTVERGLFFHKVEVKFKNPLDVLKQSYYEGITQKPEKGTDTYLVYVILYGEGNLKSFAEYFNVDKSIADDLALNFLLKTRPLNTSSAPTKYVSSAKYFSWTSTMKSDSGYVIYTRYVANSWPWFLLAALMGGIVVVVIVLLSKKSKAKAQLIDKSELEKIRIMRKSVPSNAKVVRPTAPIPTDEEIFAEDKDNEEDNGEDNN